MAQQIEDLTRDKKLLENDIDRLHQMYNHASFQTVMLKEQLAEARKVVVD
jgi:hypothetical protein